MATAASGSFFRKPFPVDQSPLCSFGPLRYELEDIPGVKFVSRSELLRTPHVPRDLVSLSRAAAIAGITMLGIANRIEDGRLPVYYVDGKQRVSKGDLS